MCPIVKNLSITEVGIQEHWRLHLQGTVQGLGFRPFVYRLARELGLKGFVCNSAAGVEIEVQGDPLQLAAFERALQTDCPPLVAYQRFERQQVSPSGSCFQAFVIQASQQENSPRALMLPDLATCSACIAEIFAPENRRYGYPFTNCTDCGPRYSIIQALPYDRSQTSMAGFAMCPACLAEYHDPANRRFHAQPNACPVCGPQLSWHDAQGQRLITGSAALTQALQALQQGQIVALKGLGGYQLLCDARCSDSIARLRQGKGRETKPFALMLPGLEQARRYVEVSVLAAQLLTGYAAPIVLLPLHAEGLQELSPQLQGEARVANPRLGVMLPYTPLHHLLLAAWGQPLLVTSGNRAEAPLCIQDDVAFAELNGLADGFLSHNRPILRPVDDSVVQWVADTVQVLRRARGYAPLPLPFPDTERDLLALGGHLKNTVGMVQAHSAQALLSQHLGDLDGPGNRRLWQQALADFQRIYALQPEKLGHDLHPDYASSQLARALSPGFGNAPCQPVQHHYAHVLAVMAEHRLSPPVLGFAWDGAGLGSDLQTLWGGECLGVGPHDWQPLGRLRPFHIPGGEKALRKPLYIALGWLYACWGETLFGPSAPAPAAELLQRLSPTERQVLPQLLRQSFNTVLTSSVGRLFDALAALLQLCDLSRFEGEAAMQVEFLARRWSAPVVAYALPLQPTADGLLYHNSQALLQAVLAELAAGTDPACIARRFHQTLADSLPAMAEALQARWPCRQVVLSGGCFQNSLLLELALAALQEAGYTVYWPQAVPPNDGGLALGQLLALWRHSADHAAQGEAHVSGPAR